MPHRQNALASCTAGSTRSWHVLRTVSSALYLFPGLHLTNSVAKAAQDAGITADKTYSNALPDEAGICAVSGTGFGQKEGKAHF
ncbi:hypothetical protein FRC06_004927, partial [Ceratobasidium sp. 370]